MTLRIVHSESDGTLLEGTTRGDGAAEVVRTLGWRWSRTLGLWFVPRSRDVAPRRELIRSTAAALGEAGFDVEVSVDAVVGDRAHTQARLDDRSAARAAALTHRADREQHQADTAWEAGRRIADQIPWGQPILLGHHSQRGAERDAANIRRQMDATVEHAGRAHRARAAAANAAAAPGARRNPVTVARRIERLGAEIRRSERDISRLEQAGAKPESSPGFQSLLDRLAIARADLGYWLQVRDEQVSDGSVIAYGPELVRPGDLVKIRGHWRPVVRCNAKSVAVMSDFGRGTAPWHEVQEHHPKAGGASPVPDPSQ